MSTKKRLILLGAGGQGRVAADVAVCMGTYREVCFLDDSLCGEDSGLPYRVLGGFSDFPAYIEDADFLVSLGQNVARRRWQETLEAAGASLATLIHPRAVVAERVAIGAGSVVMAGAVINPDVVLGRGVILNTCASVDHDCRIGDFCHISVGAHLAGTVSVGANSLVGVGVAVRPGMTIGEDCTIGVGAAVVCDLVEPGVYVGVPARRMK